MCTRLCGSNCHISTISNYGNSYRFDFGFLFRISYTNPRDVSFPPSLSVSGSGTDRPRSCCCVSHDHPWLRDISWNLWSSLCGVVGGCKNYSAHSVVTKLWLCVDLVAVSSDRRPSLVSRSSLPIIALVSSSFAVFYETVGDVSTSCFSVNHTKLSLVQNVTVEPVETPSIIGRNSS